MLNSLPKATSPHRRVELEARKPRFADRELAVRETQQVTHAGVAFQQAFDSEVLTHRAAREVRRQLGKFGRPEGVARRRIGIDCFLGPAMHAEVGLFVTGKSQWPDGDGIGARYFDKSAGHEIRSQWRNASGLNGQKNRSHR